MSSASDPAEEIECSYENDSFETAEESILADHKSSPIVWGRRESVFLAESSNSTSSAEDTPVFGETVSGSNERTPSVQSASTITEEKDYSDQFETLGSEGELSIKVNVYVLSYLHEILLQRIPLDSWTSCYFTENFKN